MSKRSRVVVVGGGFAGLAAAARIGDRHLVTLASASPHFEFTPNIHEIVSGKKKPAEVRLPLARAAERLDQRFVEDRVVLVDRAAKKVHLAGGGVLEYDLLILAPGTEPAVAPEGVEHAIPFERAEHAETLRRRVKALDKRSHVTIVGGGYTGIEVLGELLRKHDDRGLRFRIIESAARLMPKERRALGRRLRGLCEGLDVELVLQSSVARIDASSVTLDSGVVLPSALTVTALPRRAPRWLAKSGLMAETARWAPTKQDLTSVHDPHVLIAGDAAACPDDPAKLARVAMEMGHRAGANALRILDGRKTRRFEDDPLPTLLTFGREAAFLFDEDFIYEDVGLVVARQLVFEHTMTDLELASRKASLKAAIKRARRAYERADPRLLEALSLPFPGLWGL